MRKFRLNGFEMSTKMTIPLVSFMICIMHITFLILFLKFRFMPLMYFNILSVTFYLGCGILSLFRDISKHALAWIIAVFTEIVIHAVLCTLFQGVSTFFVIYPLISLPICMYYLFFYTERKVFVRMAVILVVTTFALTAGSVIAAEFFGGALPTPLAVLSRKETVVLRTVNIFFSALALFGFTLMFYMEMNHLLDRLRVSAEKLKYTASHDALTGLTNRRSFWDYFDELSGSGDHYNIAMGDLDSFKKINDTYGHGCGDLVLKSVAEIIIDSTNDNEIACRWGGEEMVMVFIGDRSDALKRLEEIRTRIESLSLDYEGVNVRVTMTFGFADSGEIKRAISESSIGSNENTNEATARRLGVESLISMADKRLYTGKTGGKNVVVDR